MSFAFSIALLPLREALKPAKKGVESSLSPCLRRSVGSCALWVGLSGTILHVDVAAFTDLLDQ